jgi:hypothetical protein
VIFSVELPGHAPVDVMARSRVNAKADGKVRGYAVLPGSDSNEASEVAFLARKLGRQDLGPFYDRRVCKEFGSSGHPTCSDATQEMRFAACFNRKVIEDTERQTPNAEGSPAVVAGSP